MLACIQLLQIIKHHEFLVQRISHVITKSHDIWKLWDNCIQNFHLWRYIFTAKPDRSPKTRFPTVVYLTIYVPKWKFWIWLSTFYCTSAVLSQIGVLQPQKATCHPTKCDIINDIKLFPTVYHKICLRKFWCYPIRRHVTKASALEYSNSQWANLIWLFPLLLPLRTGRTEIKCAWTCVPA